MIDGVADSGVARLEVGGGVLIDGFAGDAEVGGAAVGAAGGEDGAGGDLPRAVAFDEDEVAVGWDRGDAPDEGEAGRAALTVVVGARRACRAGDDAGGECEREQVPGECHAGNLASRRGK